MTRINNLTQELLFASPAAFALLFAGPAFYLSELDPIVREQLKSKRDQLQHWSKMYELGLKTMPAIVLLGSGAAIAAYFQSKQKYWIYGALTFLSIIPYTLFGIMPLNNVLNRILKESKDQIQQSKVLQVVEGMKKWTKLHRIRGILAVGALGLFFVARCLTKTDK